MKTINWVLHGISLLAIIFLLYRQSQNASCCKPNTAHINADSTSMSGGDFPVAFFYSDSLLNNLGFFKESDKAFKKKQEAAARELESKQNAFQKEVQKLQENAQNMTRNELEATQERLGKTEQEIMQRKEKITMQLAEETSEFNEKLHQKITSFLKEVNADGRYKYIFSQAAGGNIFLADDALDITPIMIKGLNEKYSK